MPLQSEFVDGHFGLALKDTYLSPHSYLDRLLEAFASAELHLSTILKPDY